jgi:CheY-like chemotaxis protein
MKKRILVVEDDGLQRHLISMFLGWHDYEVHTAANGADAIRTCLSEAFNLVLMDYSLPIVDGHSAAKLIQDFTRSKGSPQIIALTAAPERLRLEELDADEVFAAVEEKPWDPHTLLQTIGKLEKAALHGDASGKAGFGRSPSGLLDVLPRLAPDLRREIALLDGERPPGPARILIVEDDDLVRSLLSAALRAEHYEVSTAISGLDALLALEQNHYDIALMDYRLPKIDGLVAAQLMTDLLPRLQQPRLIALTSTPDSLAEREHSLFDAIVPKSADMHYVLAAIERSISHP